MDKEKKLIEMLNSPLKVVGSKQVLKGISAGSIWCVIIAADADVELRKKIAASANAHGAEVCLIPSKKRLGELAGVEVDTAAVGLGKTEAID